MARFKQFFCMVGFPRVRFFERVACVAKETPPLGGHGIWHDDSAQRLETPWMARHLQARGDAATYGRALQGLGWHHGAARPECRPACRATNLAAGHWPPHRTI